MNSVEEKAKQPKQVERAVISETLKSKLTAMKNQANAALQGIATVTKSDIVNLVLSDHPEVLNSAEIQKLKAQHLDQVKYAFWIAKQLKEAQAAGEHLTLQDLLATSRPLMPEQNARVRRPRKKKELSMPPEDVSDLAL